LYSVGHLAVGVALLLDAAGKFGANTLDVPTAEVLVEEVGSGFKLNE